MLWIKAWRETRLRFLLVAGILAAMCAWAVFFPQTGIDGRHMDYRTSIYEFVYYGKAKGVFGILVIFMGTGGLLRERSLRTAAFTLSLPVSRLHLVAVPALVGLAELAALVLLPAMLLPLLSILVGQTYPLGEALQFSLLWFGFGSAIFAVAFFFSVIAGGEFVAPAATYLVLMLQGYVGPAIGIEFILRAMSGIGTVYRDASANIAPIGLPWSGLAACSASALILFGVSGAITQRRDF
jgi:ABC-type transport system involved in multi-copper enzyme maturation permease subunit